MSEPQQQTAREILTNALADRPELVDAAVALFDLAQFLLDDDERLTKSGALDGVGREQLQARAIELLGGPPATDGDDDDDDDGEDDDEAEREDHENDKDAAEDDAEDDA